MKSIPEQCLFFLLFVMACASCKRQAGGEVATPLANDAILSIRFEQARVIMSAETDSVKLSTWLTKDSAASDGSVYHLPVHKQVFTAKMDKWEKDSMHQWVRKLIATPVKPVNFCADYVGYINLAIVSRQVRQECTYTSVCDWVTLNRDTAKINLLLKSKFGSILSLEEVL
jgi:hypothetical protein